MPGRDGSTEAGEPGPVSEGLIVMNDAEEIARLRARVAELEAEREAVRHEADSKGVSPSHDHAGRSTTRAFGAALLIILGCVLAPLAVVSVWASTVVSDTDRYVETVAPVADDAGVQAAIASEVTTAIMDNLDVGGLTTEALDTLAKQDNMPPRVADALPALAVPLTRGIEDFTRSQVTKLVSSNDFATLWAQVNRVAHDQVVALLEGDQTGVVTAQGDQITLNLAPIIEEVKTRLVDQGFGLAANIPAIDKSFVLVESGGITRAQQAYSVLEALGVWLPLIALAVVAAGVLLARDRRRALLRAALGVTGAMVLLGVTLTLLRMTYVETTPAGLLTSESAGNVFDILVRFLRTGLRAVAVLGLLVALAAFLTGPSSAAVRARTLFERGVGSARGGADAAGWHLEPVGRWVFAHKRGLQLATFIAAGLTLMFWSRPTVWTVVWVALLVALVLTVIAFLGRPPVVPHLATAVQPATAPPAPAAPPEPAPPVPAAPGPRSSAEGEATADRTP